MNTAAGSWPRFWLGVLLAPLALIIPASAFELVMLSEIAEITFGKYTFKEVALYIIRPLVLFWAFLSIMLMLMALVLRRFRKIRARHHVLAAMVTIVIVVCAVSAIDAIANEIVGDAALPDAVIVENPYCTRWVLWDTLRITAILLLFTLPALVFKWCAYGRDTRPVAPEPVWRALGVIYAAGLVLASPYLVMQRFGVVPDTSQLWC